MQQSRSGGVYAALVTPRRKNTTEIDTAAFFDYLDRVTALGVNGVVLLGTTGEFVHFDLEERAKTASLLLRRSRVPVLVNVSHSLLEGAVRLAADAEYAGAAGLLLMPPYYFHYSAEQIFQFYERFAELAEPEPPVYLYNIPAFTDPIGPSLFDRLLETGRFAGIKDSSGDPTLLAHLLARRGRHPFQIFLGQDALLDQAWPQGVDGVISGVAAVVPELLAATQAAVRQNDLAGTHRLTQLIGEFLGWTEQFPVPFAIKEGIRQRGWMHASLLEPAAPLEPVLVERFAAWFREWLPRTLRQCTAHA